VTKHKLRLLHDLIWLLISAGIALFAAEAGIVEQIVSWFGALSWVGIILAGAFFTSVFTTAPAIVLLGTFAVTTSLPALVVLGALGAVCGDYLIFRFVKDRLVSDFEYLLSFSGKKRLRAIFKTQLFRIFTPFVGALIIASPLPDEIGVAMLGVSRVKNRIFLPLSFIANGLGILLIGLIAQSIIK
jgi:hypothetical protein